MTREQAATLLYEAAIQTSGAKDGKRHRSKVIKQMIAGDMLTIRAITLSASPKGEQSTAEVIEAVRVLTSETD